MSQASLYEQIGAIIWVTGGSFLAYKNAAWFVRMNLKAGRKTDINSVRNFFLFTMMLGIFSAIIFCFTSTVNFSEVEADLTAETQIRINSRGTSIFNFFHTLSAVQAVTCSLFASARQARSPSDSPKAFVSI